MNPTLGILLKAREFGYSTPIATLTLQPDETAAPDTFIQEASPSTAASANALISTNGAAASRRNAFLKFVLSTLSGKLVLRARLFLANSTTAATDFPFPVHAILAANSAMVEGATWDYAVPSTVRWAGDTGANGGTDAGCSVAGTDYNATALGTLQYLANTVADTVHEVELSVAQMQAMVAANHGMILFRTASGVFNFHSSSATTAGLRPKLVIDYRD